MKSKGCYKSLFAFAALVLLLSTLGSQNAVAQTGTWYTRVLTFADSSTANISFNVPASVLTNRITTIWLEFGVDGSTGSLNDGDLNAVSFMLTKGAELLHFQITNTELDSYTDFVSKRIQFNYGDRTNSPFLYRLDITHQQDVAFTENWTLAIAGIPVGGMKPVIRTIVYVQQTGLFTSLIPHGPGGQNVTADVFVSSTGNTVTFQADVTNVPSGATYHWFPEQQADPNYQTISSDGRTLTYTLQDCGGCCCRSIVYRLEVKQGTTILASNRGVYLQKDTSGCGGG